MDHGTIFGVDHLALVAFNIQVYASWVSLRDTVRVKAIVVDGQHGASKSVKICDRRRFLMRGSAVRSILLLLPFLSVAALVIPGGQIVPFGKKLKEIAYVRIGFRIQLSYRVINVPSCLLPRIEYDFLVGMIRM